MFNMTAVDYVRRIIEMSSEDIDGEVVSGLIDRLVDTERNARDEITMVDYGLRTSTGSNYEAPPLSSDAMRAARDAMASFRDRDTEEDAIAKQTREIRDKNNGKVDDYGYVHVDHGRRFYGNSRDIPIVITGNIDESPHWTVVAND
jgi:hypothetical protein